MEPFVKWAGGKRQLLPQIRERLPDNYSCYYEPFVGGGAVLFDLNPDTAVINDSNQSLINAYCRIKDNPKEVIDTLKKLDEALLIQGKDCYYEEREHYNEKLQKKEYDTQLAALFIFINKHCFNGLYRVNTKGLYNVPYNNSVGASCNPENIYAISSYLKKITILCGDFEEAVKKAKKGDFIFFDSPYAPLNAASFEAYTKEGFDIDSHKRLAKLFKRLTKKGCYCMLTNHNTELIHELYHDYVREIVLARRFINSDASKRAGEEIIIRNYGRVILKHS